MEYDNEYINIIGFVLIVLNIITAELIYTKEQLISIVTESNYRMNLETFHNLWRYNNCSVKKTHRGEKPENYDSNKQ